MRKPDLTVNLYLVHHGYEINVAATWPNGEQSVLVSGCQDFGGSYPITDIQCQAANAIKEAMHNLEKTHLSKL